MDELCENIQNLKIDKKEKQIIKIQAMFRGFLQRKKNLEKTDNFDLETINKLLDKYIFYVREITLINLKLRKKIRKPNFPSELSENITKFIIAKKKGFLPTWNCNGDLKFVFNGKKIEVKAFSSDGPISFGPNENWFRLYILDCRNYINKNFICYEIKLRNTDTKWKNILVNKKETMYEQSKLKRRPRINFKSLISQINGNYEIIFNGNLNNL